MAVMAGRAGLLNDVRERFRALHRIVIEGSRACRRGADQVQVVFAPSGRAVAAVRSDR